MGRSTVIEMEFCAPFVCAGTSVMQEDFQMRLGLENKSTSASVGTWLNVVKRTCSTKVLYAHLDSLPLFS